MKRSCLRSGIFCLALCMAAGGAHAGEMFKNTEMGQVVVSASRTEQRLADTPRPTYVITADEIEARQPQNIQVLLREIPGLQVVERTGSWGGGGSVRLMGLDAHHTLVLVDGQRFIGGNDVVDIASIPVEAIERIEVVKGPASSLYGSDALGGVVQIFTKKAKEGSALRGGMAAGSRNRFRGHAGADVGGDNYGVRMDYSYRRDDGITQPKDKSRWEAISTTIHYTPSESVNLTFTPLFTRQVTTDDSQTQGGGQGSGQSGQVIIQDRIQERSGINAIAEFKPDAFTRIHTRASYIAHDHRREDGSLEQLAQSWEFEAGATGMFGIHTLSAGYAYLGEKIEDKATHIPQNRKTHSIPGDSADQDTHSLYIQNEMDFGRTLVSLGGRVSHHDDWDTEFNPQAGLVFRAMDTLHLRASVGTAFAGPSLLKRYAEMPRQRRQFIVQPNPDLKPEKSLSWQAGFDWEATPALLIRASFFRNEIDDLIVTVPVDHSQTPKLETYANIGEAVTQGVEWSASWRIMEGLRATLNHSYTDTEDKSTGKKLTDRPEHRAGLDLDYHLRHPDIRFRLTGSWIGERDTVSQNQRKSLSSYETFDLAVTWKAAPQMEIFTRIENLTNEKNIEDEWRLDGTEWMAGMKFYF
ncbi:outer membrane receptor for ferrienterochelin and colicins [Desulfobotulus alkaliphilus]|uniref:Outer membrane receptor for ferrienterochelin and colicins n=1 Tax=Desulfobotulus alkaliphilus TaxID=622671 RepID=A0A562S8H6_9BACT|nr:TonB-dependent receptor [Desulfobotulus alkaliphilus]TWI76740.1 outer membrane receptor for ferrienterochelin and colicins [Desulfobotulus alkaliphilus]